MIVYLLLLGVLLYLAPSVLRFHRRLRHLKALSAKIPLDEGLPVVGHLFNFAADSLERPSQVVTWMNKQVKEGGPQLLKLWFFEENMFIPTNGQMLKYILDSNDELTKGDEYNIMIPWLGTGLLTSTGDKWRSRRKMLTPTFHFAMLDGYISTMNRHGKICVEQLGDRAGAKLDMFRVVKMCALDIICETAMGKDLDSQRQPHQPYVGAIVTMNALTAEIMMKVQLKLKFMRYLLGVQQRFDSALAVAHNFTRTVIAERAEALERGEVEPNKRAFLDMLLEMKNKHSLSDEDIREEVDTFMFEGHDTTSSGMGWAVWCMACHPEIQERAYQEIMQVLGEDPDRDLNREDMGKLVYLDRCIKESMRLFPPVPFVSRQLQNDLQCGPFLLPRHANVNISPLVVHRNESIYPNAMQYDPDRFLPENVAARHAYDYIPFSAGPRNCIGQKFAQYEEKIIMSWLLRRFRFESDEPLHSQKFAAEAILRPVNGIKVIVHRR